MSTEQEQLEKQARPIRPEVMPMGVSGTRVTGGRIIGYESNYRFTDWRAWAYMAEEMVRTDPKLAGADSLMRHTLLSARWEIKEGKGRLAKKLAKFARQVFGLDGETPRMSEPFETQVAKMLPFVRLGGRYLEEMYWVDERGMAWLKTWADREPTAHHDWVFDKTGHLAGVTQYEWDKPEEYRAKPIPASKLLVLTLNRTGQNFEGRGLLRPCYSWWKLKDHLRSLIGVGYQRWAVPTPKITTDREKAEELGYTDEEVRIMGENAKREAKYFQSGEQSFLCDTPVVSFGTYGEGKMDASGPLETIKYCDQAMLTAWTMHFMELGLGDVGSRATGQVHENAFRRAAVNILDQIANAINAPEGPGQGTLARLIRWNFGEVSAEAMPRLCHRGIGVDQFADFINVIAQLVDSGIVTPTNDVEMKARDLMGMGKELPAEAMRSAEERMGSNADRTGQTIGGRPPDRIPT